MKFDKSECDYLCFRVTVSVGMIVSVIALIMSFSLGIYWLGGGEFVRSYDLAGTIVLATIFSLSAVSWTWVVPIKQFNNWVKREIDNAIRERES